MGRKSLIESSDNFEEILDMIKARLKPKDIHELLIEKFNENISERTIRRYIGDLKSKTNQKYYSQKKEKESKISTKSNENDSTSKLDEVIDKGVANKKVVDDFIKKGVSDINALDNLIALGKDLKLDASQIVEEFGPQGGIVVSKLDVLKANALVANIVLKAIQIKSGVLKDEPEPPSVNIYVQEIANNKDDLDKSKDFLDSLYGGE